MAEEKSTLVMVATTANATARCKRREKTEEEGKKKTKELRNYKKKDGIFHSH